MFATPRKRSTGNITAMTSGGTEDVFRTGRTLWAMANNAAADSVPYSRDIHARMTDPRPGDLVIEVTQLSRGFDPGRVGILRAKVGDGRWVVSPYDDQDSEQTWEDAQFAAMSARR